jgi:hypothetical protein
MNFRDALLADQGADRLPVEMDRRLRQRLGLETRARRVWVRPAIAAFAVAMAALVVILYPAKQAHHARVASPVTTTITAAPETRVARTSPNTVLLMHGTIDVERKDVTPMLVDVPMGRVVIAAYHSTIKVDPESVTITLYDGSGHYDDSNGQSHPLTPHTPLVWPPPPTTKAAMPTPAPVPPPARKHASTHVEQPIVEAPPGETPPSVPHADMPCTYKSDCDEGQTCRQNERKESVCMGNGAEGAACWFDNDCLSQHCVQRRCSR